MNEVYMWLFILGGCAPAPVMEMNLSLYTEDVLGNQLEEVSPLEINALVCMAQLFHIKTGDYTIKVLLTNDTTEEVLIDSVANAFFQNSAYDLQEPEPKITFEYRPEEGYPIAFADQTQLTCTMDIQREEDAVSGSTTIRFEDTAETEETE